MLWFDDDTCPGDVVEALVDADEGEEDGDVDVRAQAVLCMVTTIAPVIPAVPRPMSAQRLTYRVTLMIMYGAHMGLNFTRQMAIGETFHIKSGFSDEEMSGKDIAPRQPQGGSDTESSEDDDSDFDLREILTRRTGAQVQSTRPSAQVPFGGAPSGRVRQGTRRKRRKSADQLAKIESYSDPRVAEIAEMSSTGRKTRSRFYKAIS